MRRIFLCKLMATHVKTTLTQHNAIILIDWWLVVKKHITLVGLVKVSAFMRAPWGTIVDSVTMMMKWFVPVVLQIYYYSATQSTKIPKLSINTNAKHSIHSHQNC